MKRDLADRVASILREAAETAIVPRYRALAAGEVEEKSPGEMVTVADREAEAHIARGLSELLPGARVVGEEACAADPRLLEGLDQGMVWLVDPLDGTANFAAGEPPFAVMTALLREGEIIGAWMLDPMSGSLAAAERGAGAWIDGARLAAGSRPRPLPRRGSIGRFMPAPLQQQVADNIGAAATLLPGLKCAGAEYPMIGAGERDFAFYWRTLAWDHAAGVLFVNEAGGKAARPDGSPYRPASAGSGLLAAHSPEIWDEVRRLLPDQALASRSNA